MADSFAIRNTTEVKVARYVQRVAIIGLIVNLAVGLWIFIDSNWILGLTLMASAPLAAALLWLVGAIVTRLVYIDAHLSDANAQRGEALIEARADRSARARVAALEAENATMQEMIEQVIAEREVSGG